MIQYYQDNYRQQQARREDGAKKLILLVEDDDTNAFLLIRVIEQEIGYQVAHTTDGKTAWKFLQHVTHQHCCDPRLLMKGFFFLCPYIYCHLFLWLFVPLIESFSIHFFGNFVRLVRAISFGYFRT